MKTFPKLIITAIPAFILWAYPALAEQGDSSALEKRIEKLEEAAGLQKEGSSWFNRLTFSGLVEAEAGIEQWDLADGGDEDSSDLSLATVALGVDMDIAKHVSGHVLFLYEDGEDILVDEGYIKLDGKDNWPLYLKFGELYVPFGNFTSHMISDPLTLDLGETREAALELGFEANGLYGALYGFNGDVDEAGKESRIDNVGAMVGYALENGDFTLDAGVGAINNLLDSDGLTDALDEAREALAAGETRELRDYVAGITVHAVVGLKGFSLVGEYMAALDDPEFTLITEEETTLEKGKKLNAWNLEGAYTFSMMDKETTLALGFQGSRHTENLLPEKRILGALSVRIFENTCLALEYLHDEYENDDEADRAALQLAVEF